MSFSPCTARSLVSCLLFCSVLSQTKLGDKKLVRFVEEDSRGWGPLYGGPSIFHSRGPDIDFVWQDGESFQRERDTRTAKNGSAISRGQEDNKNVISREGELFKRGPFLSGGQLLSNTRWNTPVIWDSCLRRIRQTFWNVWRKLDNPTLGNGAMGSLSFTAIGSDQSSIFEKPSSKNVLYNENNRSLSNNCRPYAITW